MTREAVESVLRQMAESDAFAAQLGSDPSILTGYDLTPEERTILMAGDVDGLVAQGVDRDLAAGARSIAGPRGKPV